MSIVARKMLGSVDGVHSKNGVEEKVSIYEVPKVPTIIGMFSINYEMTTLKFVIM